MYANHPVVDTKLLEKIPRLENVTKMIAMQQMPFDAYDDGILDKKFEEAVLGAQTLKAVVDFDLQIFQGNSRGKAIKWLREQKGFIIMWLLTPLPTSRLKSTYVLWLCTLRI